MYHSFEIFFSITEFYGESKEKATIVGDSGFFLIA